MRLREAKHTITLCRRRIFSDAWEINAEKSGAVISAVTMYGLDDWAGGIGRVVLLIPKLYKRLCGQLKMGIGENARYC